MLLHSNLPETIGTVGRVQSCFSLVWQGHVQGITCHVLSEPLTSANNQCFQDASRSLSCSQRFRSVLFIRTMREHCAAVLPSQIRKVDPRLGARTTLPRILRQTSAARSGFLDEVQMAHVASVSWDSRANGHPRVLKASRWT